jgi:hypothetical protein
MSIQIAMPGGELANPRPDITSNRLFLNPLFFPDKPVLEKLRNGRFGR